MLGGEKNKKKQSRMQKNTETISLYFSFSFNLMTKLFMNNKK